MIISERRLFLIIASAAAPVPPPPSIITAGVEVYPEPGFVILICESIDVLKSCKFTGNVISGFKV